MHGVQVLHIADEVQLRIIRVALYEVIDNIKGTIAYKDRNGTYTLNIYTVPIVMSNIRDKWANHMQEELG